MALQELLDKIRSIRFWNWRANFHGTLSLFVANLSCLEWLFTGPWSLGFLCQRRGGHRPFSPFSIPLASSVRKVTRRSVNHSHWIHHCMALALFNTAASETFLIRLQLRMPYFTTWHIPLVIPTFLLPVVENCQPRHKSPPKRGLERTFSIDFSYPAHLVVAQRNVLCDTQRRILCSAALAMKWFR